MSTWQQTTGTTIQVAFIDFHRDNPQVYEEFKKMALQAINAGKKKISAKMIVNVIRWSVYMETIDLNLFEQKNKEPRKFKINDAFISRWARVFVNEYPQYADRLEMREIRSE